MNEFDVIMILGMLLVIGAILTVPRIFDLRNQLTAVRKDRDCHQTIVFDLRADVNVLEANATKAAESYKTLKLASNDLRERTNILLQRAELARQQVTSQANSTVQRIIRVLDGEPAKLPRKSRRKRK